MDRGQEFAAQCEQWIGTPFRWQGRVRGLGADCKGLLAGAALELGFPEADSLEALAADYGDPVDTRRLKAGVARLFDRVADRAPGDLLLILVRGAPCHMAVAAPTERQPLRTIEALHLGPKIVTPFRRSPAELDSVWRWKALG
jgi:cell wall-associated NlpC family hydrolase